MDARFKGFRYFQQKDTILFRRIAKSLLGPLQAPAIQPVWERLHRLSLIGMNVGTGSSITDSGEDWVMQHVSIRLASQDNITVFDVGANTGAYAQKLIARLGSRVRVHCFEPSTDAFRILTRSLHGHHNVLLFNLGLSDAEETVPLYSNAAASGIASLYKRRMDHFGVTMRETERVRLTTLDRFCIEQGIDRINLLKLDVEGHELKALLGGQQVISAGRIDYIQFEFGGCNIDSRTYFQDFFYLLNPRYKLFRVLRHGLAPITRYRETQEVFITTNYLAELRLDHG